MLGGLQLTCKLASSYDANQNPGRAITFIVADPGRGGPTLLTYRGLEQSSTAWTFCRAEHSFSHLVTSLQSFSRV